MIPHIIAYAVTAAVFLAVDLVWLTKVAKQFYYNRLGDLLLTTPRMGTALAFYALYVVGIVIFAVAPALREGSAVTAVASGALFGLFAYATYDMTNYATVRNWSLTVSAVDMAWGTFLTALAALAGFWGTRAILPG